ncbi:MAG: recombinase zinc beta ribbon domain-containing protein, partial [Dehalococcoidia bacterium]
LRNPAYTGLYRRLGVAVPAAHPALVDRATFQAVQRRLVAKRTSRLDQRRHEYLLSGLLRCGRCGSSMTGERRPTEAGVAVAYRCETASAQGACKAPAQRAEAIEAALREELDVPPSQHPVAARRAWTPDTRRRWRRLERRLTEGIERWVAGEWRYTELVRRMASTAEALLAAEAPTLEEAPAPEDAWRRVALDWDDLDFDERRLLLRAAIAEIVVSGEDVRVTRRR